MASVQIPQIRFDDVRGKHVLVALSGGADSVALLHLLDRNRTAYDLHLTAAHLHHGIRGCDADDDAALCRNLCAGLGIRLIEGRVDVPQLARERGQGLEEAARDARYAFLRQARTDCGADVIALAHHLDDQAETVLMHLLRGSGLRGLCGIPPRRGSIVRPLLSVTREQVAAFLRAESIAWVEDSTNAEEFCARNRLRRRVLPELRALSPQLSGHLTAQSRLLREEDAYLDELAAALLREEDGVFACAPLREAPPVLQRRALRLMTRRVLPQDMTFAHIAALQALLVSPDPSAQCDLPGSVIARRRYDGLELTRPSPETFPETPLSVPGETILPVPGLKITCEITENFKKIANTPFRFAIKYDMITQSILRPRRSGDRMSTDGVHTKTLKKLFIERHVPRAQRGVTAVLASGSDVLAVAGIGADVRYIPAAGEPAVLIQIEFI